MNDDIDIRVKEYSAINATISGYGDIVKKTHDKLNKLSDTVIELRTDLKYHTAENKEKITNLVTKIDEQVNSVSGLKEDRVKIKTSIDTWTKAIVVISSILTVTIGLIVYIYVQDKRINDEAQRANLAKFAELDKKQIETWQKLVEILSDSSKKNLINQLGIKDIIANM